MIKLSFNYNFFFFTKINNPYDQAMLTTNILVNIEIMLSGDDLQTLQLELRKLSQPQTSVEK